MQYCLQLEYKGWSLGQTAYEGQYVLFIPIIASHLEITLGKHEVPSLLK